MSPPENSTVTPHPRPSPEAHEFSAEERTTLLKLAHQAVASALEGKDDLPEPPSPHLAEPRAAFTTLYVNGELRGCVGYVLAATPLFLTVWETARAAAFHDPRFFPLTSEELHHLTVSLSILSPLVPIAPADVEIGRHGLVISYVGRRGLLLPQVPGEHGWDRVTFLEQTCRKAGLPLDAWKRGAKVECFTAEVFGDDESRL